MARRHSRGVPLAIAALAAAMALAVGRVRAEPPPLLVHTLKLPGRVLDLDVADIDGDGKKDLVIAHLMGDGEVRDERGAPVRWLSIFLQQPGPKRFADAPSFARMVPPETVVFAAGDFDPAKGGEVALLGTRGVSVLRAGPGGPLTDIATVTTVSTFWESPALFALPRWDLVTDLDNDGRPEILAPIRDGYDVLKNDARRGLVATSRISVPPRDRYGPQLETKFLNRFLTFISNLARPSLADLNADGRADLLVQRGKGLARFLQNADGTFPATPTIERPLNVSEESKKKKEKENGGLPGGAAKNESFESVRLAVSDLDRDGFSELIATKTVGEIGVFETLRTQFVIYKGGKDGWNEEKPSKILNQKGISMDPVLIDWNGDKDKDLIVSSLRMDYVTNLKRAITSTMKITYAIYLYRGGEDLYPDEPDFERDIEVELDSLERRGGASYATFEADLNGDGFREMVARVGRDRLRIVPGGIETSFFSGRKLAFKEDDAVETVVPANADLIVRDLTSGGTDRRDSLILFNPAADDPERTRVRVIEMPR